MDREALKALQRRLENDDDVVELREKFIKVARASVDRVAPDSEDELNRITELAKSQGLFREKVVNRPDGWFFDLLNRFVPLKIAGPAFAVVAVVSFLSGGLIFNKDLSDEHLVFRGTERAIDTQPVVVGVNLIEDSDPTFLVSQLTIELAGRGVLFELKFEGQSYLLSISNDEMAKEIVSKYVTLSNEERGQPRILLRIAKTQP